MDDTLYLRTRDYDADFDDYDPTGEKERKWKERYQTGSEALFFAKCQSSNETWLPLLEKAYAKVHGDYDAIAGGNPGEAVEDMTGGVTTTFMTNKILYLAEIVERIVEREERVRLCGIISVVGEGYRVETGSRFESCVLCAESSRGSG